MDTYTLLREFADSWFLIAMFSFFVGVAIWAFWPSQRHNRIDASMIPFRDSETGSGADRTERAGKNDFLKGAQNG